MILGKLEINWNPKPEYKYHSVEFKHELIEDCTQKLNDLVQNGWTVQQGFQTESGIVIELVRAKK